MPTLLRALSAVVLAVGGVACGPHLNVPTDAAADVHTGPAVVPVPVLQPLPPLAPYWVAPVRGTALGADRVEVARIGANDAGVLDPLFVTPGLDGTFCEQILLPGPGTFTFVAFAQLNGQMSAESNRVTTTFRPGAPAVGNNYATCANGDPAACDDTGNCCTPECTGRQCGSDGCGGTCGTCATAGTTCDTTTHTCCVPHCTGRTCGDDGCHGTCGACGPGAMCNATTGLCCAPACAGHNCGPDGCGGSCGDCTVTGQVCVGGTCGVATSCSQLTDCNPCTRSSGVECGWCASRSVCLAGSTSTRSTDGTCTGADWRWTYMQCP